MPALNRNKNRNKKTVETCMLASTQLLDIETDVLKELNSEILSEFMYFLTRVQNLNEIFFAIGKILLNFFH